MDRQASHNDSSCTLNFEIGGMHCASCSSRIERVLGEMPGIEKASVNLANARAQVVTRGDDGKALEPEIIRAVERLGFTASPLKKEEDAASQYARAKTRWAAEKQERQCRLWPMLLLAIPLLILSMGQMLGIPMPLWLNVHTSPRIFMLAQLALTLPVLWFGRHFYSDGFTALFRRAPNMDSLVAVGTSAAFFYSLAVTIIGLLGNNPAHQAMNLYYESCAVLLAMIELGQFLEFTARRKASDAMGALLSLTPESALLLKSEDAKPETVPLSAVAVGDLLLVRPGSRIPVDGVLVKGQSSVDLSLLTGESIPVPVEPEDKLVAGSVNGGGALVMRAVAVGQDTRLARIARLVRDAQGSKAPIARLADRVSFYFVPAVMLFAVISSLCWLIFSAEGLSAALTVFVAVMVMACPCAMGLATPMSIMVGTGRGAQLGVLIKNGAALEQAGRITVLAVDKTGTLTTGKPVLTRISRSSLSEAKQQFEDKELLALAASLEGRSEHPLGLALVQAAERKQCPSYAVSEVEISPGLGIEGQLEIAGKALRVALGSQSFMRKLAVPENEELETQLAEIANDGATPLLMAVKTISDDSAQSLPEAWRLEAIFSLADALRPESPEVIRRLAQIGVRVVMLTGDNERTAQAVAKKVGIQDFAAALLPADKADYIRKLKEDGAVVGMVGDGLNDAPALAVADVGLAVGTGVDISAEAGDIVLMSGGMQAVLAALGLSRATMRNIKENLGWAFGYNILGLPVAAGLLHIFGGPMLSPMFAGLAMALSSFSVVSNALRLRFFQPKV